MVSSIISKNSAQRISSKDVSGNSGALVAGAPFEAYVVPAGLKALVTGTITGKSFGSGGVLSLQFAGVSVTDAASLNVPSNTVTHVLEAGQKVEVNQTTPAGGNADFKLTVQESPA